MWLMISLSSSRAFAFSFILGLDFAALFAPVVSRTWYGAATPLPFNNAVGDCDGNEQIDFAEVQISPACLTGPRFPPLYPQCVCLDFDSNSLVDLADFAALQREFGTEVDSDKDGVVGSQDRCPGTPPNTPVDEFGCHIPDPPDVVCSKATGNCFSPHQTPGCVEAECCLAVCGQDLFCCEEQWDGSCARIAVKSCAGAPIVTNDDCEEPSVANDGRSFFDTVGATNQEFGPATRCLGFEIEADIWFLYTSSCTGYTIVSLCGSAFDTTLAVYQGTACPQTAPLGCSDDDCGFALDSRAIVPVKQGESYLIRVGGFPGDNSAGSGEITIICTDEPNDTRVCGPGNGPCSEDDGTPGCDDAKCCLNVCNLDHFCCDVQWDGTCAAEADGLCGDGFAACAADSGSCFQENDSAGCDNVDCCNLVCREDPFCCIVGWDSTCAQAARALCPQ